MSFKADIASPDPKRPGTPPTQQAQLLPERSKFIEMGNPRNACVRVSFLVCWRAAKPRATGTEEGEI